LIPENDEEKIFCEELKKEDYWQIRNLQNGYKAEIGEEFLSDVQQEQLIHAIEQEKIQFFVAKRKTRVVGMCSVSMIFSTFQCKCSGIFEDFFIEPLFRKEGISTLLTRSVFDWCKQQEISSLWVGCSDKDVKMYQYLGFKTPFGNLLTWSVD
jgi:GNAT superfamily N-acetyltransferase